jgi:sugar/nucleoside kinase (ribokinase family)
MKNSALVNPVDYLVVGHLCVDLTLQGRQLGGTAAYAALTAHALGMRVGVVTAWGGELSLAPLIKRGISIAAFATSQSTCFENIRTNNERVQILHHVAPRLEIGKIPTAWRSSPIVHLGPIAQEVAPSLVEQFSRSQVCLTAQGWLRSWDQHGHVAHAPWPEAPQTLSFADATVISIEDVGRDEAQIRAMAAASDILIVTEGARGARVCWQGTWRHVPAPNVEEINATGAGDIFAAAFFIQLSQSRNPWEAAAFANYMAAQSVTAAGLQSISTQNKLVRTKVQEP